MFPRRPDHIPQCAAMSLRATQELFRLANPSAFAELQQRFAREYLDTLMQGSATFDPKLERC